MSVADIKKDLLMPSVLNVEENKSPHNQLLPEAVGSDKPSSRMLNIIVEIEDEDDVGESDMVCIPLCSNDRGDRFDSLKQGAAKSRFSNAMKPIANDLSKRVSAIGLQQSLVQRVCDEWFESLPWQVTVISPYFCSVKL